MEGPWTPRPAHASEEKQTQEEAKEAHKQTMKNGKVDQKIKRNSSIMETKT